MVGLAVSIPDRNHGGFDGSDIGDDANQSDTMQLSALPDALGAKREV